MATMMIRGYAITEISRIESSLKATSVTAAIKPAGTIIFAGRILFLWAKYSANISKSVRKTSVGVVTEARGAFEFLIIIMVAIVAKTAIINTFRTSRINLGSLSSGDSKYFKMALNI
ncbi:MAG: hypothetical protein R3307_09265 [Anaerolineales bacterium]|nr:hypothetical protein [Anaerolineales bacterium]